MKRFVAFLSFVSLLVCVATCLLWVRSYYAYDFLAWTHPDGKAHRYAHSGLGLLSLHDSHTVADNVTLAGASPDGHRSANVFDDLMSVGDAASEGLSNLVRFRYSQQGDSQIEDVSIEFPHWVIALITGILPMWSLRRKRQLRRRHRQGLCPACGYDLRASPERCPECGAVPASPSTK